MWFLVDLPVAPKEFAQCRVISFARSVLNELQILRAPKSEHFEHAVKWFVRVADGSKGFGPVEVVPVFEVGDWLEELCRERELDGGHVFYAYEPVRYLLASAA